jgi:hypothetical protein
MNTFPIRAYTKKELALLFFPDSTPETAVKHLMALIRRNDMLWDELQSASYYPKCKTFTPRQVQSIVDWLGAP